MTAKTPIGGTIVEKRNTSKRGLEIEVECEAGQIEAAVSKLEEAGWKACREAQPLLFAGRVARRLYKAAKRPIEEFDKACELLQVA